MHRPGRALCRATKPARALRSRAPAWSWPCSSAAATTSTRSHPPRGPRSSRPTAGCRGHRAEVAGRRRRRSADRRSTDGTASFASTPPSPASAAFDAAVSRRRLQQLPRTHPRRDPDPVRCRTKPTKWICRQRGRAMRSGTASVSPQRPRCLLAPRQARRDSRLAPHARRLKERCQRIAAADGAAEIARFIEEMIMRSVRSSARRLC